MKKIMVTLAIFMLFLTGCQARAVPREGITFPAAPDEPATSDVSETTVPEVILPEVEVPMGTHIPLLETDSLRDATADSDAAMAAFAAYLDAQPDYSDVVLEHCILRQNDEGNTILLLRGAEGGILSHITQGLVFHPETEEIKEQHSPWIAQHGYATMHDCTRLTDDESGLSFVLPVHESRRITLVPNEESVFGETILNYSIESGYGGWVMEIYRIQRENVPSFIRLDCYPEWTSSGFGIEEIEFARDADYVYIFRVPTDLQFDCEDAAERKTYEQARALSYYIMDEFCRTNGLIGTPNLSQILYGFGYVQNDGRALLLAQNTVHIGDKFYITIPTDVNISEETAWDISFEAANHDGAIIIDAPQNGWIGDTTYLLDAADLESLQMTIQLPLQPAITVQLIP